MSEVLVSDYGIDGLKQKLKNIKWFFYKPGIHDGAHMGDDGLYCYIKSDSSLELESKLINLWGLTQDKYFYSYNNILSLHFSADQKDGYLYIRLQKYHHLSEHLQDDDFAIVEKLDGILDSLGLEYYPYVYNMEPIYGEQFRGKEILKSAAKMRFPTEEWITYSESKRRSQLRAEKSAENARLWEQSRPKGIFKRLKALLGLDKHSS